MPNFRKLIECAPSDRKEVERLTTSIIKKIDSGETITQRDYFDSILAEALLIKIHLTEILQKNGEKSEMEEKLGAVISRVEMFLQTLRSFNLEN